MKTLIAIPALSWVYTEFLQAMLALDKLDAQLMIQKNSMIYDARNNLAWAAMTHGFDRVMWIDSDMTFSPDMLNLLNADMDENGLDYVCGYYTGRSQGAKPCIYQSVRWENDGGMVNASANPIEGRPDGIVEIAGSGFGAVLMKTELIKAVADAYGPPFLPLPYMGEDLSFCWRVKSLGRKMHCDGRIRAGHIGTFIYE